MRHGDHPTTVPTRVAENPEDVTKKTRPKLERSGVSFSLGSIREGLIEH